MRVWGLRHLPVACCLALLALGTCGRLAWSADAAPSKSDERILLREGADLERSRRWVDAIELYEKALREHPNSEHLQYGLRRAKVHFSVDRRYADATFTDRLLPLSRSEGFAYLSDLLTKVQQQYVDTVTTTSFVAHGTESLYLALGNERFLSRNAPQANADSINRVRQTLRERYWNRSANGLEGARQIVTEVCDLSARELGLPAGAVVMEYVFGGCNALDDYSSYLTPGKLSDLYNNIEGEFVGIGIEMKADLGKGLLLVNVLPESPAEEGGAQPGDHITAIDQVDCRNLTTEEAAGLLQGPPGSRVRLTLTDPQTHESRTAQLTRRAVKVKSVPVAEIVDHANGIGYVQLTGFQKNTSEELDAALLKLHREGMKALVLDVRGNPGGLLNAAVEVLDRFIDDGVLVSTRGRMADQNWSYSAQRPGTWHVPLVLLVDGDSASASEVVAGAIRDHRRGQIVGRKTYGKWSVQSILPGLGETGLRLTTAKFYSPGGYTYGKIGLEPDVPVEPSEPQHRVAYRGKHKWDDDRDLQSGVDLLRQQLARR
uniref:PDZ domain-containing protein n=1 Tax=Schlesneria paludicola TaxID=360056 RepID=A0A7C2P3H0_9PLAN